MVAAGVVALAAAVSASAATGPGVDVSTMTVQLSDLAGAKQVSAGKTNEPGYDAYQRTFAFTKPSGAARVVFVNSEALLAPTADKASSDFSSLSRAMHSKSVRSAIATSLAKATNVKPKAVVVGKVRLRKVGDRTLELPLSVNVKGRRVYSTLIYMLVDRALVIQAVDGLRPVGGFSERLAGRSASYIALALTPVSVTAPAVTGTAQQGQTLTSDTGTWSVDATYTYQWQHCDTTGANCVDIDGATANTYAVGASDVGTELRVVVTASDRFGAVQAPSATTAVVS